MGDSKYIALSYFNIFTFLIDDYFMFIYDYYFSILDKYFEIVKKTYIWYVYVHNADHMLHWNCLLDYKFYKYVIYNNILQTIFKRLEFSVIIFIFIKFFCHLFLYFLLISKTTLVLILTTLPHVSLNLLQSLVSKTHNKTIVL